MAVVGELLVAIVGSNAGLSAAIARSEAELRGFSASATSQGGAAAVALRGVGIAGAAVATGAAIMGFEAVKAGANFQAAMELIHTQAGASQKEVQNLTGAVLALGPAVGMTPEQLAAGLYHIESAGLRGARAMEILKVAAQGAQIGNADLETVTNALVAAQFSGIKGTSSMSQTMAALNTIVGTGNMRMQDLASSFSSGILPAAKTFGLSITDVGAALATMTDQGVPAEEAATRLRMTFSLLGAPTGKAAGQLKDIGLSSRALADDMRKPNGLMVALMDLRTHMQHAGLDAVEQAALLSHAFGGGRSAGTIETLIGSLDKLGGKYSAITAGTGNFGEAWAATNATANQKLDDLHAGVDTFTTALGTGLIPALSGVLGFLNPLIIGLSTWAVANPGLAANILLVAGAVGALAAGMLVIGPAIAVLTGPIGLLIAAVVGLGLAWANNWGGMRDIVSSVVGMIGPVLTGISQAFSAVRLAIVAAFSQSEASVDAFLGGPFSGLATFVFGVVTPIIGVFHTIIDAIGTVVYALTTPTEAIHNLRDVFVTNVSPLITTVQEWRDAVVSAASAVIRAIGPTLTTGFSILRTVVVSTFGWLLDHGPLVEVTLGAIGGAMLAMAAANIVSGIVGFGAGLMAVVPAAIALTVALGPLSLIVLAIGAAVGVFAVAWLNNWGNVRAITATAASVIGTVIGTIGTVITSLWASISLFAASVGQIWNSLAQTVSDAVGIMVTVIGAVVGAIQTALGWIGQFIAGSQKIHPAGMSASQVNTWIHTGALPAGWHLNAAGVPVQDVAPGTIAGAGVANIAHGGMGVGAGTYIPYTGHIPVMQHGGMVPGVGPQLILAHGGEAVIPAGRGGGGISSVRHIHIEVGGHELLEYIDRELFGNASGSSSGFQGANPVTGA